MKRDRLIYSIVLILCVIGFWLFDNFYTPAVYSDEHTVEAVEVFPEYYLPGPGGGELVVHSHYMLSYNETHEQAEWVAYSLHKDHLTYQDRDRPYFEEDPFVRTKSADWRNYKGSGYDRGHLCPAGDRRFSEQAYNETFYTSNISPQDREFNAGLWNRLEQQVRRWSKEKGSLYIITGGVLERGLPGIGDEDVSVPRYFYKLVITGQEHKPKVLAFLMPNRESDRPLRHFLVPIDSIEEMTGINFLGQLPESLQDQLEAVVNADDWELRN
ncbi:DNA/RNA non-specific endonuclease [Zeaxanthinibacter sp. PT1]|uniref:DNA/RNA non-specific endonuclease n=1 Tax=Zeaxanthinibacter TaxID=561554 RepID=UPI002349EB80|nr:DNA/RNA non-specific endonuclease [Zeaxanthinibacter sp. PT1]MDC6351236.1 DNA/RNA non-specific endonuclease [Zeaxanthinibacter sp. PT1]